VDRERGLTLGLPRMHKEAGERRDFLPEFVQSVAPHAAAIVVESGIGSGLGLSDADYAAIPRTRRATHDEAYAQDVVLVLRAPEDAELRLLRPGATLVSMLHFPTRPERVRCLRRLGVDAVSLDSLADDAGRRLVEDARAVAWNGLDIAFGVLERQRPRFWDPRRDPIRVTILGAGAVGREAVEAATKYGDPERFGRAETAGVPGVEVVTAGRNLSRDAVYLRKRLRDTDILVDAAARHDTQTPVIPNTWIGLLPRHAVICDLAVDCYELTATPPVVRGIEGIPAGNLDRQVFQPDDPRWEATLPSGVPSRHRRTAVSCYSWPGVRPRECMELYGEQLAPLMIELLDRGGLDGLRPVRSSPDRALLRASLRAQPPRTATSRVIRPARRAPALPVTARARFAAAVPDGRRPAGAAPAAGRR
jgi:alanine dehydrogenase